MRPRRLSIAVGTALFAAGGAFAQEPTQHPRACILPDSSTIDGKLAGIVQYGSTRAPIPAAWTVLHWELEQEGGFATGESRTITDSAGRFWFCDVAAGTRVTLSAEGPDRHFGSEALVMPAGFARQDLHLHRADTSPGGLAIRIIDVKTQDPIVGAIFRLPAFGQSSLTNEEGRARLLGLPSGEHQFEVRHIGYGLQNETVEVRGGHTHAIEIRLSPEPLSLEPITVTMEFQPEWLAATGFYQRQRSGLGYFLSPTDIEKRRPTRFSHLVEMDPGVRLVRTCNPRCGMVLRTDFMAHRMCSPEIYMDGKKLRLPQTLALDDVPVWDIAAMEMYTGISETPPEFYGLCGSLVIWTKRRGR